jgi:DNA-binding IclR family transcriptional regulator
MRKVNPGNTSADAVRRRGIDSVATAGHILQAMLRLEDTFRLKELEAESGIAAATLHRYLVSLVDCGLVQRVEGSPRYALGLLAFQLGRRAAHGRKDAVELIAPHVQAFSREIDETCAIGVWSGDGPIVVKWFEVNRDITISLRIGARLPLLGSSTARIFGAYLPREVTEPVLQRELKEAGRSRKDADAVYRELDRIRKNGLAQGLGTHIPGIGSLSAPVLGVDGEAVASISVIGNQVTFDARLTGPIATQLRALSRRLSGYLGSSSSGK